MKKIWVYLLGILSGVILTILVSLIINKSRTSDISYFDEPGEILTTEHFGKNEPVTNLKVFQALGDGFALAMGEEWYARDLIVLLCNTEEKPYHDNQSVIAPKGKCFRQIGIYKYKSKDKMNRTVPVVMLMDGDIEDIVEESSFFGSNNNYTFFSEPGEVMSDKSYKVERVLDDGPAIARGKSEYGNSYYGLKVLLWEENDDFFNGEKYYDNQIITAPAGKHFRQVGIYKTFIETLPIVKLMDK